MNTRLPMWMYASLACLFLTACDWVDSTGSQGAQAPVTEVFLDDMPVGGVLPINEGYPARLTASRSTDATAEQSFSWSEFPLEQGNLDGCATQNGFKPDLAAPSLSEACTNPAQCALEFTPLQTDDGVAEFQLDVPVLKASVGMRYALTVTDTAGRSNTREFDFCFIAINEEPDARDDTFSVLEGSVLNVTTAVRNLMTNDEDDIDVSNNELRILEQPLVAPRYASEFTLGTDGSFVYVPDVTGLDDDLADSFVYELTDGLFTVNAKANIRIVASNRAPDLIDPVPELTATEGELFTENLALYFMDPDGGDLTFSFDDEADQLPDDGTLTLDATGLLSGIASDEDVGIYALNLVASDGTLETSTPVVLIIEPAPVVATNSAPIYEIGSVDDQTITLGFRITPVRPVFDDPDGDVLTYSMAGLATLPVGVTLNPNTGVISGRPSTITWVRGLLVEATDPFGQSAVSEPFFIRVRL